MDDSIKRIQDATGIQDIQPCTPDKVEKILDGVNTEKIIAEDVQRLVEMYPNEVLTSVILAAQVTRAGIDRSTSVQLENLRGVSATQMQVINSVTDSLKTIEETLKLLATKTQDDSLYISS